MPRFLPWSLVLLLPACVAAPVAQPTATSLPAESPTATVTPTVVWFPPTSTHTPPPTRATTPTPLANLNLGEIIYQDPFHPGGSWSQPVTNRGEINFQDGRLNIIITEPATFLASLSDRDDFSDFYAEVTTRPSLCSGKDEYGVIFRAQGRERHYRFSLSCDGEVRLDRILGQNALSLQPWVKSASVPSAAPSESRIGIWAAGEEMRLFVNGTHQFTINDEELSGGALGLFARSVGETAVTVSFSDLVVYQVSP